MTRSLALAAVAAVAASLTAASSAPASSDTPQLRGTPSVRYVTVSGSEGRYVSIAAVFRTTKALNRDRYATIAAPTLERGQELPDELFGGITPSRIGRRGGHCYAAELSQLRPRTKVTDRTWRMALRTNANVVGTLKHVTLRPFPRNSITWQRQAAARLGC